MRAKKSYGQHFLKSEAITERIAESLDLPDDCQKVIEIGPGKGMLTKYLTKGAYELYLVEADRDMVAYISEHFPDLKERLFAEDVLKLNFSTIFDGQFAVIGNFPYNISSQIVFKVIENRAQIPQMVGMFQKEVAERITAPFGSRTYGIISVLTQAYYDATYLFEVDRENFSPPPKVQSAVIKLTRKDDLNIPCDEKLFKRVVKTTFSQRRKMLRNTLKMIIAGSDLLTDPALQKRPEHMSVADFIDLTIKIEHYLGQKKEQEK